MKRPAFSNIDGFIDGYPEIPCALTHTLTRHHMFALEDLVALAGQLEPHQVEYSRSDVKLAAGGDAVPDNGLSVADTIRQIESNKSWMVLKNVETNPEYAKLLKHTLYEIAPFIMHKTGKMLQMEAFVFVSSPNAITPLHFDPEHNILLQLRGEKIMSVFPQTDTEIAPGEAHERFQLGQQSRNLVWKDEYMTRATTFRMEQGDAVYVPVMAPHWVKNGPAVSVSFSLTWRSEWSYRAAEARAANALLRRVGFDPAPPRRWPHMNEAKSLTWRAARRVGLSG